MTGLEDLFHKTKVKNPCYNCDRRTADCHAKCPDHAEYIELRRAERLETAGLRKAQYCAEEYTIDQADRRRRIREQKNKR